MDDLHPEHTPASPGHTATESNAFLTLGHVLSAIGAEHDPPITLDDIRVIRHSYNTGEEMGLRGREDLTEERIREYTRCQGISPRHFPAEPERYWVVLVADGQRRSRLWGTFENHGEVAAERTDTVRYFDLHRIGTGGRPKRRICLSLRSPTATKSRSPDSTTYC